MDDSVQKYRAFVEVARQGSFTRAAESLGCSQSGISRMISGLERDWGLKLMERDRGGVRLTSEGRQIMAPARELCEAFDRMQAKVDSLNGLESGLIRIGIFSSVATHWLPRIVSHFQEDYPNIDYELLMGDYSEIEGWVEEGRVDCGFVKLPTRRKFDTLLLEHDELKAVIPESHPLAGEDRFPIAAFGAYPEFPYLSLERGADSEAADLLARNGIEVHAHFATWDDYAIMSMVESGLGVSILPGLILKRIPYHVAIRSLDVPAYRDIALIMRDRADVSRVTRHFIDYLGYRE